MVPLPDMSPVICTSRMKVLVTLTGACHVAPLSVVKVTSRAPPPTLKSFQETYMFPKCGEDGLLSAQPDSRSSTPLECTQKWFKLPGALFACMPTVAANRRVVGGTPILSHCTSETCMFSGTTYM